MESAQQPKGQSTSSIAPEQRQSKQLQTSPLLVLEAYLGLIRFDLYMARGNFELLYNKVRSYPTRKSASFESVSAICAAVDMACIWYFKEALCLQRSAVTVCMLRKYGVAANLVIGAQQMPFKAHAWVEVDSKVVNDKQYVAQMFGTLTRC